MGIEPAGTMSEAVAILASGDLALLYTDGLHSLKTEDGTRMTYQSLAEVLAACDAGADLLPRLIAQLAQRSDAQPFEDDLAAISMQRE